jgi:hypothetical protein
MSPDPADTPITFASFVLSLAATAAVHFGDLTDPATGQAHEPDLAAATQLIDILAMLEQKTRGNLTDSEERLLSQALYELRLRHVTAREQKRIIVP